MNAVEPTVNAVERTVNVIGPTAKTTMTAGVRHRENPRDHPDLVQGILTPPPPQLTIEADTVTAGVRHRENPRDHPDLVQGILTPPPPQLTIEADTVTEGAPHRENPRDHPDLVQEIHSHPHPLRTILEAETQMLLLLIGKGPTCRAISNNASLLTTQLWENQTLCLNPL